MGVALVAISAPVYWLGLLALFLFSTTSASSTCCRARAATRRSRRTPRHWFMSLLLPWFVLAAAFAAFYARMVRGNLIEVMGEDYIRTARAKGLSERRVVCATACARR